MKKLSITLLTVLLVSTSMSAQSKMNEAYTKFLSAFSDSTCYAVVNLDGQDILLVSQETYNNVDGNNRPIRTALAAQAYSLDSKGGILALGEMRSQGTLYPLSLSKDGLMTAGHAYVNKYSLSDNALSIVEDASVTYLKDNAVKCYYENRKNNTYRNSSDEKDFEAMINTFETATPVAFVVK